jgi:hypothetical protein
LAESNDLGRSLGEVALDLEHAPIIRKGMPSSLQDLTLCEVSHQSLFRRRII